ncbi:MAG: alpha-galactosidase, partial [Bacilli bacterium]
SFALASDQYQLIHLSGSWANERQLYYQDLSFGLTTISSTKGASSATHNPFIALIEKGSDELQGNCFGFNLVYSGNFTNEIETNVIGQLRLNQGINPFTFKWTLKPQTSFHTPQALLTYSNQGLNALSLTMHQIINNNLINPRWSYKKRPVLLNNWEATYFTFDENKILDIALKSKELGIELFVLDDGWFLNRNDATSSLGDWEVDLKKIPMGLKALSHKINEMGLDFGLWIEPEMISLNSKLYHKHPDWILGDSRYNLSHGRNQFVLNLSNHEVVTYLENKLTDLFNEAHISYVKWDMNRNISEVFSNTVVNQVEVAHRYILGLYQLLERLTNKFPHILFESCAAGGNRFDLGMLAYTPQIWTSDNTDAYERQKIQYGTSIAYPLSCITAHVSSVPNHQLNRITSLKTRYDIALCALLGYELDPTKLDDDTKPIIKHQISYYQKIQALIINGTFWRLKSPFNSNGCAFMIVAQDQKKALVVYAHTLRSANEKFITLKLPGLLPDKIYEIKLNDHIIDQLPGEYLINIGLIIDIIKHPNDQVSDFSTFRYEITCL